MSSEPLSNLRGSDGLLKTIAYPRNPDGRVNWRAMLRPEHLYVNPDFEDELKMKFGVKSRRDIDVTKCSDHQLLVLLEGWRYLLRLRGIRSIDIKMDHVSYQKASATCSIELIGNYETGGEPERWSDSASASLHSVSGSFQLHLEAMAANRALARCARAALGVQIYGKDEYDPKANKEYIELVKEKGSAQEALTPPFDEDGKPNSEEKSDEPVALKPVQVLTKRCRELDKNGSHSFESIKKAAIANKTSFSADNGGPEAWTSWESIPPLDAYTMLTKINTAASAGRTTRKKE